MLSQLWAMKQGARTVSKYEAKFNCLVKFARGGIRDDEATKMQKFRDGLNLDLQLDVQGMEIATLGDLINKVKSKEEVRNKIKAQDEQKKSSLGKRPFGAFLETKKFEAGSGSGAGKKPAYEKAQGQVSSQGQGQGGSGGGSKRE